MGTDHDNARYVLRVTWRWTCAFAPGARAVDGMALLFRFLGFRVERACHGADHVSFRLLPPAEGELSLGEALARLETWEEEAIAGYPATTWHVSVELPCPRRTTAFGAGPVDAVASPTGAAAFGTVDGGLVAGGDPRPTPGRPVFPRRLAPGPAPPARRREHEAA